jgi:putative phosphoribosyl transferase
MNAPTLQPAQVSIPAGPVSLPGTLVAPPNAAGVVLFAHGSGSSRHSPRNRFVAAALERAGLGTLLFDLLTEPEAADRGNVFDIDLLAQRLLAAARWAMSHPATSALRLGFFGASTGAAAALVAAAEEPQAEAVVSRGGRPDLAGPWLPRVSAPTLLIVGGYDLEVLELNREALALLRCPKELAVVPGATHLFEEPGTLAGAARLAGAWFTRYLGSGGAR